jgi:hypothetical protein
MAKKYKVLVRFNGTALLEVSADNVDGARRAVADLELADITRVGHADVLSLEIAPREITETTGPGDGRDDDDPDALRRPRPSGWYRPA